MELVEMMDHYWKTHEAKEYPHCSTKWFEPYTDEEGITLMTELYDKLFIDGGHWNLDTKSMLQNAGYSCWVGDVDSFGILVACIKKDGKALSIG